MDEPNLKRKTSLMDKTIKEQRKVLIIATFFLVTLFFGSSYALLTNFDTKENAINVATGNLNMSVGITNTSGTAGAINLDGKLPENDTDGLANATPVVITLKNTGTMNIMKYEVKLVADTDETKVTTLESQYIKYAISLDNGETYLTPANLQATENIIYTGYNLDVFNSTLNNSKVIYLKVWIDETAGNNALSKTFYGSINVELYQKATLPAGEVVKENIKSNNTSSTCQEAKLTYVEDGITYISGSAECVDFNYLWYSGKMWRITAIYPDGAMKLVTENNITSIAFNESGQVNFYTDENTTSYIYQWLNEDFYDTLYNASSFIDTTKQWNATMTANTTISTKPENTNLVTANVGLLNSYEYYNSYRCNGSSACTGSTYTTGYLKTGYYWWLLNPYSTSGLWKVDNSGSGGNYNSNDPIGARPSIYLKSEISLTGNGTSTEPYKIVGDMSTGNTNDLVNTRLSGEYVKLKNGNNEQVFRIVGVEDSKTKIVAMDYADNKATRKFATSTGSTNTLWGSGTTTGTDTWYTYLNNTYLNNLISTYDSGNLESFTNGTYVGLFASGTYYFGTSGYNYKLSICANTTSGNTKVCEKTTQVLPNSTNTDPVYIGLLRYGEMFATHEKWGSQGLLQMWLINRRTTSSVWYVSYYGNGLSESPSWTFGARPTVHLNSSVKILSGSGTENDPYVVGL